MCVKEEDEDICELKVFGKRKIYVITFAIGSFDSIVIKLSLKACYRLCELTSIRIGYFKPIKNYDCKLEQQDVKVIGVKRIRIVNDMRLLIRWISCYCIL